MKNVIEIGRENNALKAFQDVMEEVIEDDATSATDMAELIEYMVDFIAEMLHCDEIRGALNEWL